MVEVRQLYKSFGEERVLEGVNLRVSKGEVLAVLGVSGAGKTTLLRIIAGLEPADKGKVFIEGRLATEGENIIIPPWKRKIGFIFQNLGLWEHMSVEEHLRFVLSSSGREDREELERLLTFMDLLPHRHKKPHQLSGGQRQRLAFARALAQKPSLLLLDEPLSNLDMPRKRALREELLRIKALGKVTIIYVTHDPLDVRLLSDRVAVLQDGRIIQTGPWQELVSSPAHPVVKQLLEI